MRFFRTVALWVEAVVCFGPPALLLVVGLPMLGVALFSIQLAFMGYGNFEQLGIILIFVGGILGLIGAARLARRAVNSDTPVRFPRFTLFCLCAGNAALGAATSRFEFSAVTTLLMPLAATLHFLYLARTAFIGNTTVGAPSRSSSADAIVAVVLTVLAIGGTAYTQGQRETQRKAAGLPATPAPDPCMRWFRSGNFPQLSFHVDIKEAQWEELSAVLGRFAQDSRLEFHDGSQRHPDSGRVLQLSACSNAGTHIMSSAQHWRIGPKWDWTRDQGVDVLMYAVGEKSDWKDLVEPLQAALNAAWPGKVTRSDRQTTAPH